MGSVHAVGLREEGFYRNLQSGPIYNNWDEMWGQGGFIKNT